jgi:hypothetical protein
MKKITDKVNTNGPSNGLPFGTIRDRINNVQGGTPVNTDVYSDMHQFFQQLASVGRVHPNGQLENANGGFQLMDALFSAITSVINPNVSNDFLTDDNPAEYNGASLRICYGGGYFFRCHNTGSKSSIMRSFDCVKWEIVFDIVTIGNYVIWDIDADNNGNVMAITGTNKVLYSDDYGATFNEVTIDASFNAVGKQKRRIKVLPNNRYILSQSTELRNASSESNILLINSSGTTLTGGGVTPLFEINDIGVNLELEVIMICGFNGLNTSKAFYSNNLSGTFSNTISHTAIGNDFVSIAPFTINQNYSDNSISRSGFIIVTNNAFNSSTLGLVIDFVGGSDVVTERSLANKNYFGVKYGNGRIVLGAGTGLEQSFNFLESVATYDSKLPASTSDLAFGLNTFAFCGGYASTPKFV